MKKNVALIVLYDSNKKILLQHRTNDAPTSPGKWGYFGGKIEEGETPKIAVLRETKEELNYELKNPKLVIIEELYHEKRYIFIEKYNSRKKLTLYEGKNLKWYNIEEALKLEQILRDIKPSLKKLQKIFSSNKLL